MTKRKLPHQGHQRGSFSQPKVPLRWRSWQDHGSAPVDTPINLKTRCSPELQRNLQVPYLTWNDEHPFHRESTRLRSCCRASWSQWHWDSHEDPSPSWRCVDEAMPTPNTGRCPHRSSMLPPAHSKTRKLGQIANVAAPFGHALNSRRTVFSPVVDLGLWIRSLHGHLLWWLRQEIFRIYITQDLKAPKRAHLISHQATLRSIMHRSTTRGRWHRNVVCHFHQTFHHHEVLGAVSRRTLLEERSWSVCWPWWTTRVTKCKKGSNSSLGQRLQLYKNGLRILINARHLFSRLIDLCLTNVISLAIPWPLSMHGIDQG